MNINARKINQKKYIEIYGLLGNFELPGKKTKVRYFSTNVSSRDKKSDVYLLLKELKPMRERVKANELKNLDSLLQRNLNDYRVAEELIPYLLTSSSPIAFFPAILAVLIPNGFLSQENGIYPLPKTTVSENGNTLVSFDDSWKLEIFKIDDKDSNLGILSIDTNDIDVVVLDGQHRANAFRVVSNAFPDKDSSVYPAFYQSIQIPSEFNAELPVTIIWFENEEIEFDPRFVSRKLFVHVNM